MQLHRKSSFGYLSHFARGHQIKNKAIKEIKLISLKNILLLYQRNKEQSFSSTFTIF